MNSTVCAILLAAGSSVRMGRDADDNPINKLLLDIGGSTPIERCARAFLPYANEFVIAASTATAEEAKKAAELIEKHGKPCRVVQGGERRQDSVCNALYEATADIVAIHDCARCLVSGEVIKRAVESAKNYNSGVAAVSVRDTLRNKESGESVSRQWLVSMQTPQCFNREMLFKAYQGFVGSVTDDAAIWQRTYGSIAFTEGDIMNQKLTEAGDVPFFRTCAGAASAQRVGYGEDTHVLTEGRRLILGGVEVPFDKGLLGHSDADALTHAIIDALLGAAALGDIGRHFPDSDMQYKDISSLVLLKRTAELLRENGFITANVDATIVAQKPKLAPYIEEMRKKIAGALRTGIENVSVKATTPEGMGPEGELKCITARAVAVIIGG